MSETTTRYRLIGETTVTVEHINSVLIAEGVKVEFEFTIRCPGFEALWGATERVLPWPLTDIPGSAS